MTRRLPPLTEQERAEGETLRIDLPPELVKGIKATAASHGVDPRELVRQLVLDEATRLPLVEGSAADVWRGLASDVWGHRVRGESINQVADLMDEEFDRLAATEGKSPSELAAEMLWKMERLPPAAQKELVTTWQGLGLGALQNSGQVLGYLRTRAEGTERERDIALRIMRLAREWTGPHGVPVSAGNFELLAMNAVRFISGLGFATEENDVGRALELCQELTRDAPEVTRCVNSIRDYMEVVHGADDGRETTLADFLDRWFECGFPRLEVGHKYASALCCTDCPASLEVRAPWLAWSLVVPPGLFGETTTPARLWVLGTSWVGTVWPDGSACTYVATKSEEPATVLSQMLHNLIAGACLSLTDVEQHRKKGGGQSRSKGNGRHGPPDLAQARFLLAPPVSVDLRAHVLEALRGGHGGHAPKVQFLVRGHWRQQAHGPARAQRKTIWIEPHWKGPEEARVLLRSHKLGDE